MIADILFLSQDICCVSSVDKLSRLFRTLYAFYDRPILLHFFLLRPDADHRGARDASRDNERRTTRIYLCHLDRCDFEDPLRRSTTRDVQRALHPLMIGGGPGPRGARPQAPKKKKKREKRKKKRKKREKKKKKKKKEKGEKEEGEKSEKKRRIMNKKNKKRKIYV